MSVSCCAIVIIGASGDLTRRKLVPALHALYLQGKLDPSIRIIGSGRSPFTHESFRERFTISSDFSKVLFYHQHLQGLRSFIDSLGSFKHIYFFLSQPPSAYALTAKTLNDEGFGKDSSIIIEKPFGYNYESARNLDLDLAQYFDESQIYRIDHYLAKEAVQNIMVFRFANTLFNPVWNNRHIESIQISAIESEGIVERAAYFDGAGTIRDMIQNHLLQLLCLLTMDAPVTLDAEDIRAQKVNVLRALKIEEFQRYQYEGYKQEKGVASDSNTETYAELKLSINNFRWAGVPVYIRTGKALHRRGTEIGINFRPLPPILFNESSEILPNRIVFKIQPAEGIILDLSSKMPGAEDLIAGTHMNFCYRDAFEKDIPEAYQRLLYDALKGDHTLFVSALETETAWKLLDKVLDKGPLLTYPPGKLPPSFFPIQWIDFDHYVPICA